MFKKIVLISMALAMHSTAIFGAECVTASNAQVCCGQMIFEPESITDVQQIITDAVAMNKKVRAVAALHGSVDAVCVPEAQDDDLWLVKTEKLNRILEIDLENKTVTLEAGVPLFYLGREMAKHGLEPIAFPGAYDITIGGMVANAVHGTGRKGSYVDTVLEVTLVDGQGNIVVISDTSNPQWLPAVRCCMGLLGFIYSVKISLNPQINRDLISGLSNVQSILPAVDELLDNNQGFQFQWNPYTLNDVNLSTTQALNFTNDCKTNNIVRDYGKYAGASFINGELGQINPAPPQFLFPVITDAIVSGLVGPPGVEFFYKASPNFHDQQTPSVIMELSIPKEQLESAVEKTRNIADGLGVADLVFFIFNETRFVQDEKFFAYLSPYNNFNRPNGSWNMGIITIGPRPVFANDDPNVETEDAINADLRNFYETWYDMMVADCDARPVWSNNPMFLTFAELNTMYGAANVTAFNAVRTTLDPNDVFLTPYWADRLTP
ncbi:MAG: FAD-dependent oxidoreductase [Candidatus Dependentiae bacterium]